MYKQVILVIRNQKVDSGGLHVWFTHVECKYDADWMERNMEVKKLHRGLDA